MTTRRRFLVAAAGGAMAALPVAARAQFDDRVRRVGMLMVSGEQDTDGQDRLAAFRQTLATLGWDERRNLKLEVRWTAGDPALVRKFSAELATLAPDVIVGQGTPNTAALKSATRSIPVVFAVVNDPVAQGFVASMSRPGANLTGFSFLEYSTVGKSLEMLKQVVPATVRVAVMFNPETYPYYANHIQSFETVARTLSLDLNAAPVRSPAEIEEVVEKLGRQPGNALLVTPDPFVVVNRRTVIAAAVRHRLPANCSFRQQVREGALMSYGADTLEIFRRSAVYVDRILRGAKPADLPVQAPDKYEVAFNLKTAAALGLTIPATLLATADEVVE
jgi:putative ABC transport system substrate-binding protein